MKYTKSFALFIGMILVCVFANASSSVQTTTSESVGSVGFSELANPDPVDSISKGGCGIVCTAQTDNKRCGSGVGLLEVCEGGRCRQSLCETQLDCVQFASQLDLFDSCRTYSCVNGQCIDQINVDNSPNSTTRAGAACMSDLNHTGLCSDLGVCTRYPCTDDNNCPKYALECSMVRCDNTVGVCNLKPLPDGIKCTNGTCVGGFCG